MFRHPHTISSLPKASKSFSTQKTLLPQKTKYKLNQYIMLAGDEASGRVYENFEQTSHLNSLPNDSKVALVERDDSTGSVGFTGVYRLDPYAAKTRNGNMKEKKKNYLIKDVGDYENHDRMTSSGVISFVTSTEVNNFFSASKDVNSSSSKAENTIPKISSRLYGIETGERPLKIMTKHYRQRRPESVEK